MKKWFAALMALICMAVPAQAGWFEPTPAPTWIGSWVVKWDEVVELKCTPPRYLARHNITYSLLDADGRILKDSWLDGLNIFADGTAPIRIGGKWGVISETGEILVEPKFDYADWFYDGLCRVELDGLRGFVNMDGEYVVEPKYFVAKDFMDGYAAVGDRVVDYTDAMASDSGEGAVWGLIDTEGRVVVELEYDSLNQLEGMGAVIAEIDDRYGVIDYEGRALIPIEYGYISTNFLEMGVLACEKEKHSSTWDDKAAPDREIDYYCMKDGEMVQIPYPEAAKEGLG